MPYEPPAIVEVGNVRDLTMGNFLSSGQDSWNTVLGFFGLPDLFGS